MPAKSKALSKDYIAGFFDGEGHITINKELTCAVVGFTNTNLDILKEIQQIYGGHIVELKRYKNNHSRTYQLQIAKHDNLVRFANDMALRVNLKKTKLLALEIFIGTYIGYGGNRRYGNAKKILTKVEKFWRDVAFNLTRFNNAKIDEVKNYAS